MHFADTVAINNINNSTKLIHVPFEPSYPYEFGHSIRHGYLKKEIKYWRPSWIWAAKFGF